MQWLHGAQGITIGTALEVCVHAVEMVLVPTGNYYVGGAGIWAFRNGTGGTTPRLITSENFLPYADTFTATLSYGGAGLNQDFSAGFPKGYEGFYSMKYELSQGEYVAYLNKLTRVQQAVMVATNVLPGVTSVANRYVMTNSAALVSRSTIRCPAAIDATSPVTFVCDADGDGVSDEADDGAWVTANYVNAPNALAYLDWCGLRPMSEMEFEKACRGPGLPVANAVPTGGNTSSVIAPTGQTGLNTATEDVDAAANGSFGSTFPGPFRCGVFAEAGATRASAGASYYGIMDLGGNVAEYPFLPASYPCPSNVASTVMVRSPSSVRTMCCRGRSTGSRATLHAAAVGLPSCRTSVSRIVVSWCPSIPRDSPIAVSVACAAPLDACANSVHIRFAHGSPVRWSGVSR